MLNLILTNVHYSVCFWSIDIHAMYLSSTLRTMPKVYWHLKILKLHHSLCTRTETLHQLWARISDQWNDLPSCSGFIYLIIGSSIHMMLLTENTFVCRFQAQNLCICRGFIYDVYQPLMIWWSFYTTFLEWCS